MTSQTDNNFRPDPDALLIKIADYVANHEIKSQLAYDTAKLCLVDSLGCAALALQYPGCTKLLGPVVPGTEVPGGVRVLGTQHLLDPIKAAFDIGALIRWLDFNDTWLAAEWGHPSDNLGAILSVADFVSQQRLSHNEQPVTMHEVLTALIKAYEIQGVLALENSFNRVGLDHVILVKLASVAVATQMLGGTEEDIVNALSLAWVDGQSLRTYRHAPNAGSRKSWAAGDATARAVQLAMMTLKGEMGYPTAISASVWGFQDVLFKGNDLKLAREFDSYVMENILFKISFPAEFHAQTAVEAAIKLHPQVEGRLEQIDKIILKTQDSAVRIISKAGPLYNFADRDHCLQYMVAIGLLFGELQAHHYEDGIAQDLRIDALREQMHVQEHKPFSVDYLDPDKRAIGNAIQVCFKDGSSTEEVSIDYPVGHRRRREEGIPLLWAKFAHNMAQHFEASQVAAITELCQSEQFDKLAITDFMAACVK